MEVVNTDLFYSIVENGSIQHGVRICRRVSTPDPLGRGLGLLHRPEGSTRNGELWGEGVVHCRHAGHGSVTGPRRMYYSTGTLVEREREREMFYLTTHSTHFIYGYMSSDIWLRTIRIVRKETRCRHIGYSYRLTARVLLYAPSHRQDNTYHGFCYTSRGTLAGTRNSSMGPSHEGSIRRPTAPWANTLPLSYVSLPW